MTASDAESWARLRLVEGESSAKKWELVGSLGHTTLTVGSNSDCTWVVRGEGVRPIHFSLHWDGSRLRAADVYSAGDVRIDNVALNSQWRPLEGRVRIDFGRAAMVVETSPVSASTPPRSAEHPLEGGLNGGVVTSKPSDPSLQVTANFSSAPPPSSSAPPPNNDGRRKSSAARNSGKETLIGVAPQTLIAARMLENYQAPSVTSELPEGVSHKEARRAERERAERERPMNMKATLVGGIGMPGTPAVPSRSPGKPAPSAAPSSSPAANATLMGFNMADALRAAAPQPAVTVGRTRQQDEPSGRSDPSSLSNPDQRTVQGFPDGKPSSSAPPVGHMGPPGRRMTQKGMVSQQPGVHPGAVAQAPVRSVSAPPGVIQPGADRIGSAWQEQSDDPRANRTLRGVQEYDPHEEPESRRPPRMGQSSDWGGREERLSDIPTQMRDPTTFESRRPSRGFPWRYVGVLVLTGVAYFAWLYLLDHM